MNPAVVNKNSDLFENFLRKWLISQPFSDRQLNPGTLGFILMISRSRQTPSTCSSTWSQFIGGGTGNTTQLKFGDSELKYGMFQDLPIRITAFAWTNS